MADLRPGDRIELIYCLDPHTRLRAGDRGTVTLIDDAGTVHVYWDEGSRCSVVPGEDGRFGSRVPLVVSAETMRARIVSAGDCAPP